MVVVENENLLIVWIRRAADSCIPGAKVAVRVVAWKYDFLSRDLLTAPRPILSMSGDNYPFLTQRMPSFFPCHIDQDFPSNFSLTAALQQWWLIG
jgi:hypothetical protein